MAEVVRRWYQVRRRRLEGPDDHVASLQAWLDRLVRRLRRGPPPPAEGRRFLIVQIDGLSRSTLERALAAGYMPFVNRLLRRERFRLSAMSVGLPTSTPAFQMALLYGVKPDIPGFHYHDRRCRDDVYFPRVGDAARIEAAHADGRRGILSGGSSYGCTPLTLDEIDHRYPGLVDDLSRHRGIGFVLARSEAGAVCIWQGKRARLGELEPGPFAGREDLAIVIDGIGDLMAMPSAGDLVIYGHQGR